MDKNLPKYTKSIRIFEYVSIILNIVLSGILFIKSLDKKSLNFFEMSFVLVLTWLMADLISGCVHWMADTWGSPNTKIIGPLFIRSFREHHVDPLAMTYHDWIETNGANFFTTVPVLFIFFIFETTGFLNLSSWIIYVMIFLNFWVVLTNQIHKWAHHQKTPKLIQRLQSCNILLSPQRHQVHHRQEHDKNYCITSGVFNIFFEKINFFKFIEKIITLMTGVKPRSF